MVYTTARGILYMIYLSSYVRVLLYDEADDYYNQGLHISWGDYDGVENIAIFVHERYNGHMRMVNGRWAVMFDDAKYETFFKLKYNEEEI